MRIVVSKKGEIVLPVRFRKQDGIKTGQQLEVERIGRGEYRLIRRESEANEGLTDWLLGCPEKGHFVPVHWTRSIHPDNGARPSIAPRQNAGTPLYAS